MQNIISNILKKNIISYTIYSSNKKAIIINGFLKLLALLLVVLYNITNKYKEGWFYL